MAGFLNQDEIQRISYLLKEQKETLDQHERLILNLYKEQALEDEKRMTIALVDTASKYNNTIIVAGYTAFFAGWSFFRTNEPSVWYEVSFLSVIFSVFVFVIFNIWSNIAMGKDLFRKVRALSSHKYDIEARWRAVQQENDVAAQQALSRQMVWTFALVLTIIPGIGGAGLFFALLVARIGPQVVDALTIN